jgi:hypothetical protein
MGRAPDIRASVSGPTLIIGERHGCFAAERHRSSAVRPLDCFTIRRTERTTASDLLAGEFPSQFLQRWRQEQAAERSVASFVHRFACIRRTTSAPPNPARTPNVTGSRAAAVPNITVTPLPVSAQPVANVTPTTVSRNVRDDKHFVHHSSMIPTSPMWELLRILVLDLPARPEVLREGKSRLGPVCW